MCAFGVFEFVHACVRACVRCVRACVRVCMHALIHAYHAYMHIAGRRRQIKSLHCELSEMCSPIVFAVLILVMRLPLQNVPV